MIKKFFIVILLFNFLFANDFNLINKLFNLNLSKEKLLKSLNYYGKDYKYYLIVLRYPTIDKYLSAITTLTFVKIAGNKIKEDPAEYTFVPQNFINKNLPYLEKNLKLIEFQTKILKKWIYLILLSENKISKYKLIEKEIDKEYKFLYEWFISLKENKEIPNKIFKFLYNSSLFNWNNKEYFTELEIKHKINKLSVLEFRNSLSKLAMHIYKEYRIYPEYFNAFKLFDLEFKIYPKSFIQFGDTFNLHNFYSNINTSDKNYFILEDIIVNKINNAYGYKIYNELKRIEKNYIDFVTKSY